jgi:hypothetical protein
MLKIFILILISFARISSTSFVKASYINNDTPYRILLADSKQEAKIKGWTPTADLTLTSGQVSGLQHNKDVCTTAGAPEPELTSQSRSQHRITSPLRGLEDSRLLDSVDRD